MKKKIVSLMLCVVLVMGSTGFALADRGHWFFEFYKGEKHSCGPVRKSDNEQNAYVTLERSGDNYFHTGKSVIGLRVRQEDGTSVTNYKAFTNYVRGSRMGYVRRGYANWRYKLHAQVDSSSQTNRIRVWGYWNP